MSSTTPTRRPSALPLRPPRAVITGASVGLGRATALGLARAGMSLVLLGRSRERHLPTLDACRALGADARHVEMDLADLASVAEAARILRAQGEPISVLILNAGVAGVHGLTRDGFELAFGVNHVGHALLTESVLPLLHQAGAARIVTVASRAHFEHRSIDWTEVREPTRTRTGWYEYGRSKLANLLTSRQLGLALEGSGITTYGLHPGVVASEIWKPVPAPIRVVMKLFMESPERAARTTLRCAIDPALSRESGLYYERARRAEPAPVIDDALLAEELRERTMAWIEPFLERPHRAASRHLELVMGGAS